MAAYPVFTEFFVALSTVIEPLPEPSPALFGSQSPAMLGQPLYFHELAGKLRLVAFTEALRLLPDFSHVASTNGFHVEPTWKPAPPLCFLSTV